MRPIEKRENNRTRLDVGCLYEEVRPLNDILKSRVIGQDDSLDEIVCSFSRLLSGLRDPGRPLLTMLLLGPTGVGKTETAKALAHTLFGSDRALTRVNCEEYAHSHELSRLLGAPPGYVGSNIEPLLSQARIEANHRHLPEVQDPAGPVPMWKYSPIESSKQRMTRSSFRLFCSTK